MATTPRSTLEQRYPARDPNGIALRTQADQGASRAIFQTTSMPCFTSGWANPWGPAFPIELRTWVKGFQLQFQTPASAPPFKNYDWANPRGYAFSNELRTWINQTQRQLIGADKLPFGQTNWPVPNGYIPSVSLKTFTDPLKLNLRGKDVFFGLAGNPNHDWPVPKGPSPLNLGVVQPLPSVLRPAPPPGTGIPHQRFFIADVGRMMGNG